MVRSTKTRSLAIYCDTVGCPQRGKIVNRVSGFDSEDERSMVIEQWHGAHEAADFCPRCGVLGHPDDRV